MTFQEITDQYNKICYEFCTETGLFGSKYNGLTVQWLIKSPSAKKLRGMVRELKKETLPLPREEKYNTLRELWAIKPGVHEHLYFEGHHGRVIKYVQEAYRSNISIQALGTIVLKHVLSIENLEDLPPFTEVEPFWMYPLTNSDAQAFLKAVMEETNWKALEELKPMDSWLHYAPCSTNEGPLIRYPKEGDLQHHLKNICNIAISYEGDINALA